MPELPEVEVVRRGLADHVAGRTITTASIRGHRVARRHAPGPEDLADRLRGRTVTGAHRRGKYLWLALADGAAEPDEALIVHLGMSGQMLVADPDTPEPKTTSERSACSARSSAQVRSAVVSVRTPGVFETGMPSSVAAATSMLS